MISIINAILYGVTALIVIIGTSPFWVTLGIFIVAMSSLFTG